MVTSAKTILVPNWDPLVRDMNCGPTPPTSHWKASTTLRWSSNQCQGKGPRANDANPDIFNDNIKLYVSPTWNPDESVPLALNNGPCGTIDMVLLNEYPQEASAILKVFSPKFEATQQVIQPQTVTVSIQGVKDKEADAKMGVTKLLLLHIAADVSFDKGTITNITITQATPSKGMDCVLATPRSARPQAYSNLLKKTCIQTSTNDPLNIRSTQMTLKVVQKTVASNLLGGNFATKPLSSSFLNEANSIDPSIFMPQRNISKIESVKMSELAFFSMRS